MDDRHGMMAAPSTSSSHTHTARARAFTSVKLRLHQIECVKTTKEVDRDEIVLAAVMAEGELQNSKKLVAKAKKGAVIDAGKFKKGEKNRFGQPRTLAEFRIGKKEIEWPRHYAATLILIEKDEGAIGSIVNSAVRSIQVELTAALSTSAAAAGASAAGALMAAAGAGAAAGSVVPLVGTAVGAAVATATTLALNGIKKARADDVFEPKSEILKLNSAPAQAGEINGSKKQIAFKGFNGIYRVTVSWAVS